MTRPPLPHLLLPVAFAIACAAALWSVRMPTADANQPATDGKSPAPPIAEARPCDAAMPQVRWRVPMQARPTAPCAFPGGWIVADAAGGVTALSQDGETLWRTALTGQVFEAAAAVAGDTAIVAAQRGLVAALRLDTGRVVWTRTTDASFQRPALIGTAGGASVAWLLSQADGTLICLKAADGETVWQSEPTNRCDGEPAAWQGLLAYGNCDGAVHMFDAETGRLKGSVPVGADAQMAGGMLVSQTLSGQAAFIAGTRGGSLVAVDPAANAVAARIKVSERETFITPVAAFDGLVATGTDEGDLVFCRFDGETLQEATRVALGNPVSELAFAAGRLYALAGGDLRMLIRLPQCAAGRMALGDDVYGLSIGADDEIACIADQSVVCMRTGQAGGGQ